MFNVQQARLDWNVLLILVLPWILLCFDRSWLFAYGLMGFIDPWIYLGYFLDLSQHLRTFKGTYYGSRLGWILPGSFAYHVFPPIAATYVLHVSFYYIALISLYLILKYTANRRTAILITILLGCYSPFLWAIGWEYMDGAALAYFLLTLCLLTYAAKSRDHPLGWLAGSGVAFALCLYTQLFLISFGPLLVLYFVFARREFGNRNNLSGWLPFSTGFVALTGLFAAINYHINGEMWFFLPSVREASGLVKNGNPWLVSSHTWWISAWWLVSPAVILLGSVAALVRGGSICLQQRGRFLLFWQVFFLVSCLILLGWQLSGQPVLQLFYYTSYLIPAMFLALGSQFAVILSGLRTSRFALIASCALLIFLLPLLTPIHRLHFPSNQPPPWVTQYCLSMAALGAAGATLILLRGRWHAPEIGGLVLLASLASLNITISPRLEGHLGDVRDLSLQENAFLATVDSVRVVQQLDPAAQSFFWYNSKEEFGELYRSVSSAYLWGYRLVSESFPTFNSVPARVPSPGDRVFIVSRADDAMLEATQMLQQKGLGIRLIAKRTIQKGVFNWNMALAEVHGWPTVDAVGLSSDAWPTTVTIRWSPQRQQVMTIDNAESRRLFQSDMSTVEPWGFNRYGSTGEFSIQPNCFGTNDSCGLYSSGDVRDHLASPFEASSATRSDLIFFSIWVRSLRENIEPRIILQDEKFVTLAEADELTRRGTWVLYGNCALPEHTQKVRMVVMVPVSSAVFLGKALLVEIPSK